MLKVNKLFVGYQYPQGRSSTSGILCRHKGGSVRKRYLILDNKRLLMDIPAMVCKFYYSSNTNTKIALILYTNGFYSFIAVSDNVKIGDFLININSQSSLSFIKTLQLNLSSSYLPIKFVKPGSLISNLELYPSRGAKFGKSYGSSIRLIGHNNLLNCSLVKLPSGELRLINFNSKCVPYRIGKSIFFRKFGSKAGQLRRLGVRPTVRGVAMNPIDHPHGGGEGKTSGGRPSTSPWGWLTKGPKTRSKNKKNLYIVKRRSK